MDFPTDDECQRFYELIEELDRQPESRIPSAIEQLIGLEAPIIIDLLRIHYSHEQASETELTVGTRLVDRYTITEKLGGGGMGVVYRAKQDHVKRDVALKVIHPKLVAPKLVDRFRNEIATLGKLEHPNIVHIYDADLHSWDGDSRSGTLFFTMQLVEGTPIHRYVRDTQLPIGGVLELLIKICRAVHEAHEQKVIHRDLKPDNILVSPAGEPIVLDFGLAALAGELIGWEEQGITGFSGTPSYMAPEQYNGSGQEFGDGQSIDVYALGVIAFELLTGASPYDFPDDASRAERSRIVRDVPPRRLNEFLEDSEYLDAKIRKCLRKNPSDRYWTASGFAKALTRALSRLSPDQMVVERVWKPKLGDSVPGTDWILESKIAKGGMGEVWLAQRPGDPEKRVFKFCVEEDKVRYLKREASLFRLLKEKIGQHPGFVRLHDVSLDDPPFYVAMDHVPGSDLKTWSESKGGIDAVPIETRIEIVAQAASTVQLAHEAGIFHRDIKPGNLLIESVGEGLFPGDVKVFVADFGIGQIISSEASLLGFTKTQTGSDPDDELGTRNYRAPELEPGSSATVRSEIFSLGVVLYQCLIGDFDRPCYEWDKTVDDPLLKEDLDRCLSIHPEKRFGSANELAESLRGLGERRLRRDEEALLAEQRERAAYRKGQARVGAVALAIIFVISGLAIWAFFQTGRARVATSEARLGESSALLRLAEPGSKKRGLEIIRSANGSFHDVLAFRNVATALMALPDTLQALSQAELFNRTSSSRSKLIAWNAANGLAALQSKDQEEVSLLSVDGPGKPLLLIPIDRRIAQADFSARGDLFGLVDEIDDDAERQWRLRIWDSSRRFRSPLTFDNLDRLSTFALATEPNSEPTVGFVAYGQSDGELVVQSFVYDTKTESMVVAGTKTLRAEGNNEPFSPFAREQTAIAFNPSVTKVAVASLKSLHVLVWDLESRQLEAFPLHRAPVRSLSWIDDARFVAGCLDADIYFWDLTDPSALDERTPREARFDRPKSILAGHNESISGLALSADKSYLISADLAGRSIAWDLKNQRQLATVSVSGVPIRIGFSSPFFFVEDAGRKIHAWHVGDSEIFKEIPFGSRVRSVAFSQDSSEFVVVLSSALFGFQSSSLEPIPGMKKEKLRLGKGATFISESTALVTTGDGLLEVGWNRGEKTRNPRKWTVPGRALISGTVNAATFALSEKDTVYVGMSPAGESEPNWLHQIECTTGYPDLLQMDPLGKRLAVSGPKGEGLEIFDLETGKRLPVPVKHGHVAFRPTDDLVAVHIGDECRFYNCHTWELKKEPIRVDGVPAPLAFDPSGSILAVTTDESIIELLDFPKRETIAALESPSRKRIRDLKFSLDGRLLVATTDQGTIQIWRIPELKKRLGSLGLQFSRRN